MLLPLRGAFGTYGRGCGPSLRETTVDSFRELYYTERVNTPHGHLRYYWRKAGA